MFLRNQSPGPSALKDLAQEPNDESILLYLGSEVTIFWLQKPQPNSLSHRPHIVQEFYSVGIFSPHCCCDFWCLKDTEGYGFEKWAWIPARNMLDLRFIRDVYCNHARRTSAYAGSRQLQLWPSSCSSSASFLHVQVMFCILIRNAEDQVSCLVWITSRNHNIFQKKLIFIVNHIFHIVF